MTSPVDTSVKYFHSGMVGAPVLSGTAGALIAVLDACLVNGFGLKTVDSLVVAGNVVTMTIASGHSAEVGAVQLVAGATPAALNGEQKVTEVTATTIKFATTGISDQTATGSITAKVASAGWAKAFSGTNLAAYKSTDVTATGCLLRVDDTVAKTSRVVGYETMSDVNNGTGPFPTALQRSGGSWWTKSNVADSTSRTWMLVSDGRLFYFAREANPTAYLNAHETMMFGDCLPTKSGDPFACALTGHVSDLSASSVASANNLWSSSATTSAECYMPRSYTGLGSAMQMVKHFPHGGGAASSAVSGVGSSPYPNPADGGLYVSPMSLSEAGTYVLRATFPGLYCCPQSIPNGQFAARDSLLGVAGLSNRLLKALTCQSGATNGVAFFDITGPWR